jgi:general secretion pathway protein H
MSGLGLPSTNSFGYWLQSRPAPSHIWLAPSSGILVQPENRVQMRNKNFAYISRERGFTLVEVMVVMVIIALIMGLVATSMSSSISSAQARAASRNLVASLRYTRARAIIDKKEQVFKVDIENRSYKAPGREEFTLPEGVDITITTARSEVTSEAVSGIRFFPDGGSTGGHIELTINDREYRVNVAWLTGETSLQRAEG